MLILLSVLHITIHLFMIMIYLTYATLPPSSNTIITIFLVQSIINHIIINDYINTSNLLLQTALVPLQVCLLHRFHLTYSLHLSPL